jgi:uncharacterized protein
MVKGVKLSIILISVFLLVLPVSLAVTNTGHIKLLAVYQEDGEFHGSPADVQLEIKPGSGRVFLETIPLSKVDTQISTRFAKELACKFADVDCGSYDFFYTIKSPAGIVGGPSAGGAISALTVALLLDLEVDQDTAMTGTINSGELIGPVGSVKEKIDTAKESEIKTVLIPAVQATPKDDNATDLVEYGKELGVRVVPVATLGDAVQEFTGEVFEVEDKEINVPESYNEIMEKVADQLCTRSDSLIEEFDVFDLTEKKTIDFELVKLQVEVQNLTRKGKKAFESGNHYSAASYCFGANVKARTLIYNIQDLSSEARAEEAAVLKRKIDDFDKITERRKKETITDLQTYMIVKERVLEARQYLATGNNDSSSLGYVEERLNSAVAWSEFFGDDGKAFNLDEKSLEVSCAEILGEVDERFQYLNLFFPGLLSDLRNNLVTAHQHYEKGEYSLCIYLASRTKSEANIIVTMLGVKEEVMEDVLDQKLLAAKRGITKQVEDGIFPIIAYSYYEYSTSLQEDNPAAALLYSEYALGLSDIDIYFDKKKGLFEFNGISPTLKEYLPTVIFFWGLVLGFVLGWLVVRERRTRKRPVKTVKSKAAPKRRVPPRKRKKRTRTGLRLR